MCSITDQYIVNQWNNSPQITCCYTFFISMYHFVFTFNVTQARQLLSSLVN